LVSRLIVEVVKLRARRGLTLDVGSFADIKAESRQRGVRLRRQGYVFVARNYMLRGVKGEIDLLGYDGETLAFVEVRTRTMREDQAALPELSVTSERQQVVTRTARRFVLGEAAQSDILSTDVGPHAANTVAFQENLLK
jgi:Holliday junction resolvase-like predicted endonuclease